MVFAPAGQNRKPVKQLTGLHYTFTGLHYTFTGLQYFVPDFEDAV